MKTNPSIQMRRTGPPTQVLCDACRETVTTLAPGERAGPGGEKRSGRCCCGRPWSVAVVQEDSRGS